MRRHSHPPPTEVRLCLREPNGRSLPRFRLAACRQRRTTTRRASWWSASTEPRTASATSRPTWCACTARCRAIRAGCWPYDQGVGTFGLKETLFEWRSFPRGSPAWPSAGGSSATSRAPIAPRRALPARRPDIPLRLFPRGLRGAGAGRDAARGGPDRCAPAAPLRLRLDPAHHPHAAPRRRQAGRRVAADRTSACWDASARSSAGR